MTICRICLLNQNRKSEGIIKFAFEKYNSKWEIKRDILEQKKIDPNYLLYRNEQWDSNILHELMYYIFDRNQPYISHRRQYFMGLCAISEMTEFKTLLNDTNCNDEKPVETFIYRARKDHKYYNDIIRIMYHLTDTDVPFKITQQMDMSIEAKVMTKEYHNLQNDLHEYLINVYKTHLNLCDKCQKPIYIFLDYEKIIPKLRDEDKEDIRQTFEKIINLRERTMKIYSDMEVRHLHFLNQYYKENLKLF